MKMMMSLALSNRQHLKENEKKSLKRNLGMSQKKEAGEKTQKKTVKMTLNPSTSLQKDSPLNKKS